MAQLDRSDFRDVMMLHVQAKATSFVGCLFSPDISPLREPTTNKSRLAAHAAKFIGDKSGRDFKSGGDFSYASFMEAKLAFARFVGIDLSEANFEAANCTGAWFEFCTVEGAQFTDTNLSYATFHLISVHRNKPLESEPAREDLPLLFTSFTSSDCSNATFDQCDLNHASFVEAVLKGAKIKDCSLENVNLKNATLDETDLSSVKNWSVDQLLEAKSLYNIKPPLEPKLAPNDEQRLKSQINRKPSAT